MNLAEHLIYKDITELNRLAEAYDCSCNHHSKMELIQSIHHTIFSKAQSEAKLKRLSREEIWICTFIFLQDRSKWFQEDIVALINKVCRAMNSTLSPEHVLNNIKDLGWIHLKREHNSAIYIIPEDLHKHIQSSLSSYWLSMGITPISIPQEDSHVYIISEGDALLHDCLTFLRFLVQEPRQLTTEGGLHKRDQLKLFKLLLVEDKPLSKVQWRFGFGRRYPVYPTRFALLYDFCFAQEYIEETPAGYVCTTIKGEKLLNEGPETSKEAIRQALYRFWIRSYRKAIPNLTYILSFLNRVCMKEWVSINQLYKVLEQWIEDFYYEHAEMLWEDKLLKMACHLGLYELAEYNGERYIRCPKRNY